LHDFILNTLLAIAVITNLAGLLVYVLRKNYYRLYTTRRFRFPANKIVANRKKRQLLQLRNTLRDFYNDIA